MRRAGLNSKYHTETKSVLLKEILDTKFTIVQNAFNTKVQHEPVAGQSTKQLWTLQPQPLQYDSTSFG